MYDTDEEKNQQLRFQMCALNGKGSGAQGSGELGRGTHSPQISAMDITPSLARLRETALLGYERKSCS